MIVPMQRVRVLAPGAELPALLLGLQDAGVVHLVAAGTPLAAEGDHRQRRLERQLRRGVADAEGALALLAPWSSGGARGAAPSALPLAVRRARHHRREVDALAARREALLGERELLLRYRPLVAAFERLAASAPTDSLSGHLVLLREGGEETVARVRGALEEALGTAVEVRAQPLAGGQTALLALVPASSSDRLERLLAQAGLEEVELPAGYGTGFLAALPRLRLRRGELAGELTAVEGELRELATRTAGDLAAVRALLHDQLRALAALPLLGRTEHAAVVEGWVPAGGVPRLQRALGERLDGRVSIEQLARESWQHEEAPVELRNPRLFRPFETLVRPLPLPRYGSLDPTPFVAVFFPMFFGLILGDLGYGALLLAISLFLARGAPEGSLRHSIARIAGACALFTLVFGLLFGELFGDLGRHLGLRPLLFDREEAVVPFLVLAVALGFVHLLLGLVAGALASLRGDRRGALGRGLAALMLLLVGAALLAALDVLPAGLLRPAVVALLVTFPVLVVIEGIVAPIELLSTLGHVLSYARIMAIGTASVMMAVVANRMVGTFGSVLVGTLFALLFHLVNFALGLFSPAVHALRLHYVEFFGTCYSPGGVRYQPLSHWRADPERGGAAA